MKKGIIFVLMMFCWGIYLGAQPISDTLPPSATTTDTQPVLDAINASYRTDTAQWKLQRFKTNISLGSSFTGTSGYGSGFTTFVAPSVTYRVNPRLSFRAGVTLSNTSLFDYKPWFSGESVPSYDANFTKALIFVEGSYMITPRLMISGAAFKVFTLTDDSPFYNPFTQNNPHGICLNADYQITKNLHVQAGFSYTKGYNPYLSYPLYDPSPFQGSFTPSPFYQDSFGNSPGW